MLKTSVSQYDLVLKSLISWLVALSGLNVAPSIYLISFAKLSVDIAMLYSVSVGFPFMVISNLALS